MSITHVYAGDIVKTSTTEDGDLLVYGKATGPDLDLDEQRCDPDWLKSAMPGWAEWGNVREQHSSIAAGVGVETVQDGDDWYVKSLVVDAGTRAKVEKKVLKGYSIGIKGARVVKDATAPGGRIVGGEIVEISLVDRPCNPTATMAIAKTADGALAPVDVAGELVMDLTKAVVVDKQPQSVNGAAKSFRAETRLEVFTNGVNKQVKATHIPSGRTATGDTEDGALAQLAALVKAAAAPRPYLKAALETVAPQLRAELEKALAAEATAFDREAAVVVVAEVLAGTRGPVELNKAAGGYDESADIAGALAVIKQIAQLICSEAESLGQGRLEEAWDIGCLMDAVRSMSYFLACERAQDSGVSDDVVYVGLDAEADTAKTTDGADATKGATIDQTFEKDAVTLVKALATSKERIAALEADLAKARAQPAAGGPAIMRVDPVAPATVKKTGPSAEYYRRMAESVPDAQAQRGYLQLAKQAAADAAEGQ